MDGFCEKTTSPTIGLRCHGGRVPSRQDGHGSLGRHWRGRTGQARLIIAGYEWLILFYDSTGELLLTAGKFLSQVIQFRNLLIKRDQPSSHQMREFVLHIATGSIEGCGEQGVVRNWLSRLVWDFLSCLTLLQHQGDDVN